METQAQGKAREWAAKEGAEICRGLPTVVMTGDQLTLFLRMAYHSGYCESIVDAAKRIAAGLGQAQKGSDF